MKIEVTKNMIPTCILLLLGTLSLFIGIWFCQDRNPKGPYILGLGILLLIGPLAGPFFLNRFLSFCRRHIKKPNKENL